MKRITWRKHHKWFGLLFCFFMLMFCWSGIVLNPVSYTHLRAHETRHDLVCRLLLEKKKIILTKTSIYDTTY